MQVPEPQFVLNTTTLAAIGGIMGVLTGAISFLCKALLDSKDHQIKDLKTAVVHIEETYGADRDYWRDFAVRLLEPAERAMLEETLNRINAPPAKQDE
jgi:hypothetical protein